MAQSKTAVVVKQPGLADLESRITASVNGIKTNIVRALKCLYEIKSRKLYKETGYISFKHYVEENHHLDFFRMTFGSFSRRIEAYSFARQIGVTDREYEAAGEQYRKMAYLKARGVTDKKKILKYMSMTELEIKAKLNPAGARRIEGQFTPEYERRDDTKLLIVTLEVPRETAAIFEDELVEFCDDNSVEVLKLKTA